MIIYNKNDEMFHKHIPMKEVKKMWDADAQESSPHGSGIASMPVSGDRRIRSSRLPLSSTEQIHGQPLIPWNLSLTESNSR